MKQPESFVQGGEKSDCDADHRRSHVDHRDPQSQTLDGDPVGRSARAYSWPATKPDVPDPSQYPGWLGEGTDRTLALALSDQTKVVVELGAWLGMSARYIVEHAPKATVISVDHWEGSPEHRTQETFPLDASDPLRDVPLAVAGPTATGSSRCGCRPSMASGPWPNSGSSRT